MKYIDAVTIHCIRFHLLNTPLNLLNLHTYTVNILRGCHNIVSTIECVQQALVCVQQMTSAHCVVFSHSRDASTIHKQIQNGYALNVMPEYTVHSRVRGFKEKRDTFLIMKEVLDQVTLQLMTNVQCSQFLDVTEGSRFVKFGSCW